ncbi:DUF6680 family protein [Pseudodesulfovibrio indicus]|uniref:DUF6680 family protein n=1 Tax=Pseudodesulfovibrio indicus TaxID=1716143 RepID=UPI00292D0F4F|nr:DUF6680 family protein [Pseudodesulfovibrio indicus]
MDWETLDLTQQLTLVTNVIMILAVIVGPIFAVWVGRILESSKDKRRRQERVFTTLMSTRGSGLNPAHVEALNLIDVEFASTKALDVDIRDHWRLYLNNLSDTAFAQVHNDAWSQENKKRLVDLLHVISKRLNYKVDKAQIESGAYLPVHFKNVQRDNDTIRFAIASMLYNNNGVIPIKVVSDIEQNQSDEVQRTPVDYKITEELTQRLGEILRERIEEMASTSNDSNPTPDK